MWGQRGGAKHHMNAHGSITHLKTGALLALCFDFLFFLFNLFLFLFLFIIIIIFFFGLDEVFQFLVTIDNLVMLICVIYY